MTRHEIIDMIGVSGREWRLSGESVSPVMMAPNSTGLYETAVEPIYSEDVAYGERFEGVRYPSTTVVWTAQIGADLGRDPETWHSLYSDFRADLDYEDPVTIRYTSTDGVRTRKLRLEKEPKPFSVYNFEGRDPHLFTFGSIVLTMKTELPFYVGKTWTWEWKDENLAANGGSTWFPVSLNNPASVEAWKRFVVSDRAEWVFPDPSFGSKAYGRSVADRGRTTKPLKLGPGEGAKLDSHPDEQTVIAENDALVIARWGDDLLYPIPKGKKQDFIVRVNNCTNPDGARFRIEIPRWYLNPFSRPRITL
ncbi:hypothetical protein B1R94_25940 [Mycolicibacterium litorale]|nr:hypothetical protein B1R94_25940 [Mycolicibacterium litorale]